MPGGIPGYDLDWIPALPELAKVQLGADNVQLGCLGMLNDLLARGYESLESCC